MARHGVPGQELHTAWLLRPYVEQDLIPDFERMTFAARRAAVERERNAQLLKLQRRKGSHAAFRQARKNYAKSAAYIHLTQIQRLRLAEDIASTVGNWGFARLFAECIDKLHHDPIRHSRSIEEQALEQVISRFERYLDNISSGQSQNAYGLTVHDKNQTVARKHTEMMRYFHQSGTLWTKVNNIIETPMFVDSSLTSMVQIADLCAYALRRFVENGEVNLFLRVFPRADRMGVKTVGVRHFSQMNCACQICGSHG